MPWLVAFLQAVRVGWFQAWLENRRCACSRKRLALAKDSREAWLADFDKNGNYLHWSGWWESNSGWCFLEGRWMWLVPEEGGRWVERADLAPKQR